MDLHLPSNDISFFLCADFSIFWESPELFVTLARPRFLPRSPNPKTSSPAYDSIRDHCFSVLNWAASWTKVYKGHRNQRFNWAFVCTVWSSVAIFLETLSRSGAPHISTTKLWKSSLNLLLIVKKHRTMLTLLVSCGILFSVDIKDWYSCHRLFLLARSKSRGCRPLL